jgi:phage protein U
MVGLLELSAEAFGRAARMLIDLDGEIIGAWTINHTWRFDIDVDKDDGVEQFQIRLWDAEADDGA